MVVEMTVERTTAPRSKPTAASSTQSSVLATRAALAQTPEALRAERSTSFIGAAPTMLG